MLLPAKMAEGYVLDLTIYGYIVTVSEQCLSVAIILSNKMDFSFCVCVAGFPKSGHIYCNTPHNMVLICIISSPIIIIKHGNQQPIH